jgi:hypothetical protein
LLIVEQAIDTPFRRAAAPTISLVGESAVATSRPLPIDMDKVRGGKIRIFIWMKGEDAGARNNDWHCPSMIVVMKDRGGRVLSSVDPWFKTQRTFPWHCYYTDCFVPEDAAGVHLRFYNKFNGIASFAMPSWEIISEHNTYSANEKQDPYTGSCAFNPIYDPMPYHLDSLRGTLNADRYKWRFVLGDKIGLVGQPYDITTKEGFRRYYFEEAKKEPDHMNHAIMFMGSLYRAGMEKNLLPPMEEGWLENFAGILINDQDPKTGFWHDGKSLSLGLTFHLVDMHFRYRDVPRADREDRLFPAHDVGLKRIPYAENIIRSVLRSQSTWVDETGARLRAAWGRAAYRYTEMPDQWPGRCDLGTTWDAINLIRRASNYVDADLRRTVDDAVKDAFHYLLRTNVYDDGTFRQSDLQNTPTGSAYMEHIMEDAAWLERKTDSGIPSPKVTVERLDHAVRLNWHKPEGKQNSVRIYAASRGTPRQSIDESFLVGIIHLTGNKIYEMDPFPACMKIRHAMHRRWGTPLELPPPGEWRGERYLPWKLRKIKTPLPFSVNAGSLFLDTGNIEDKDLYYSACTWYGEETPLQKASMSKGD